MTSQRAPYWPTAEDLSNLAEVDAEIAAQERVVSKTEEAAARASPPLQAKLAAEASDERWWLMQLRELAAQCRAGVGIHPPHQGPWAQRRWATGDEWPTLWLPSRLRPRR